MKKYILLLFLFMWFGSPLWATHQRAGEITFKYISGLTYEITIVTYSYELSPADRYELDINWGDNTKSTLARNNGPYNDPFGYMGEVVGPYIKKNLYIGTHTYPGASTYKITLEDPNRNYGIMNIPNSVEVPLFVETELIINPFIGANSSPQLLLPPIDQGCVDQPFLHNPGAYDPDGDSLSFSLTTCRGANGEYIPGFQLPNQVGSNVGGTFTMNPLTGEILWQNPKMQGEYNIAFLIEEWRHGLRIGYITRDMQITIVTCDNHAPVIETINDTCVEAGDTISFKVVATDADANHIKLTAAGAPFQIANPAEFISPTDSLSRNTGIFRWETTCGHVRKAPYQVYFKATDDDEPVNLFDLKSMNITVVGPAPKNLTAKALGNTIQLKWNKNRCTNVSGYKIYRRNGFYGYIAGYCETGVPSYTGYQLIATSKTTDTLFVDDELSRGIDYCYMTVATYPDGAESYASNEACAQLKKDAPVLTNVSITKTGSADGSVYLAWSKPTELDMVQAPGPFKYLIYRSEVLNGVTFALIDSLPSINDTIYFDEPVNTSGHGLSYRIDLYNDTPGNRFFIGSAQKASSVFITFAPGDKKVRININANVPWTNESFVIFRKNETTLLFDSVGTSMLPYYVDLNLENNKSYCYKVKAIGTYGTSGIIDPLINYSQEACSIPNDNEPPCPPILSVQADCATFQNVLTWTNPDPDCSSDIAKYLIYYQPPQSPDYALLDSTQSLTYTHTNLVTIAGCYQLVAVDAVGNRSTLSDSVCIDSDICGTYRLPNIFTPNADERNDLFIPFPYTSVEKVDMQIVNRWGNLIFATQDPDIKWDGKIQGSNEMVSDGVYYYICDVYEITLNGTVKRTLRGSITVIK
ncbi:MAG: gliding motility-associated C-terminal domain-containing protein [Bacteroidota bacterium]